MNDPYTTLGVSRNASEEEIKKAYRDLARKYHPDNYHDNPLADLAQEKMKEVNEAYDAIIKGKANGGNAGSGYGGYSASSTGSPEFSKVRTAINAGNIQLAEQLLSGITNRGAEWNFLMGSVCYRKGWLDEARNYYQRAINMDPTNQEYRQAVSYMNMGGQPYSYQGYGQPAGLDACDICTGLMCMNMCCRC